jgi:hypothetical protein
VYDLCFGNFGHIQYVNYKNKFPSLISFFPLYAFSEEVSRISSLGPEETVLAATQNNRGNFFREVPQTMLIHPRFGGFSSNILSFPENLPFVCSLVVLRFDIISSKLRDSITDPTTFNKKFQLLEYQTVNLESNINAKVNAELELTLNQLGHFTGKIKYELLINDSHLSDITIDVKDSENNFDSKTHLNKVKWNKNTLNHRFEREGFYQVLSPQTLVFRVSAIYCLTSGWIRKRKWENDLQVNVE